MTFIFLITGIMGLLLAYAYARTLSLYIPIAIHLGWNFTQGFVFSEGSIGNGIFINPDPQGFRTNSYSLYFLVFLTPMICTWVINYLLLKKRRRVEASIYEPQ
jgi:hypothetical protein